MMPNLSGKRVFVVEDEPFVAMLLEDMIMDLGGLVSASAMTLPDALKLASNGEFDIAILDVNLQGEMSFPVAEVLARRGTAVVFVTGYARDSVPQSLRYVPIIPKPYTPSQIGSAIDAVLHLN